MLYYYKYFIYITTTKLELISREYEKPFLNSLYYLVYNSIRDCIKKKKY